MSGPAAIEWGRFSQDPRRPEVATIRASDHDRGLALDAIGEAYADGRLDREEYDARAAQIADVKTFGELLDPLRDLTTDHSPRTPGLLSTSELRVRAESHYRQQRQQALVTMLLPNLVCWAIYVWTAVGGEASAFPWPVFVTIGTGMNLARVLLSREQIVVDRVAKLERRQEHRLERQRQAELGRGSSETARPPEAPE